MSDNWLTVSPQSGKGDSVLTNAAGENSGRGKRSSAITAIGEDVGVANTYTVTQEGKDEFVSVNTDTFSVTTNGGEITISGKSNSPKIAISIAPNGGIPFEVPTIITIDGYECVNGEPISGDIGANRDYSWEAIIRIPRNTAGERSGVLFVSGSSDRYRQEIAVNQDASTRRVSFYGTLVGEITTQPQLPSLVGAVVNYGDSITAYVNTLPDDGQYRYSFDGWYDGAGNRITTSQTLEVENITSDCEFTAVGVRQLGLCTISVEASPLEGGVVSGGGQYEYSETVSRNIVATANPGYEFVKWVEVVDGVQLDYSTSATAPYYPNGNRVFIAIFAVREFAVTIQSKYIDTLNHNNPSDYVVGTTGGDIAGGDSGQYPYGDIISLQAVPAVGYKFYGWYDENGGLLSSDDEYSFVVSGVCGVSALFYKIWGEVRLIAYDVINEIANPNCGFVGLDGTSQASGNYPYMSMVEAVASPNPGYEFAGWYRHSGGQAILESENLRYTFPIDGEEVRTLYAHFTKLGLTITYVAGQGVASVSRAREVVEYGENAIGSTALVLEGYEDVRWYDINNREVGMGATFAPYNVQASGTYIAKAAITQVNVQAIPQYREGDGWGSWSDGVQGGVVSGGGAVDYGSDTTLQATPNPGYNFDGWYDEDDNLLGSETTLTLSNVTQWITVFAKFQKKYFTVQFTKGVGVALDESTMRVAYGGQASSGEASPLTGYSSVDWGWVVGSGKAVLNSANGVATLTGIVGDITLIANGVGIVLEITYTKNGNVAKISKQSESLDYGGVASCVATLPTDTDEFAYSFDGWYDGNTKVSSNLTLNTSVTENKTFEARGVRTRKQYTLSGVPQYRDTDGVGDYSDGTKGGTCNSSTAGYGYGVSITASPATGYNFDGWYDANGVRIGSSITYALAAITNNVEVYPRFTKRYFTITYHEGDYVSGDFPTVGFATERVAYGGNAVGFTVQPYSDTAQYTYSFDGWYDANGVKVGSGLTFAPQGVVSDAAYTPKAIRTINAFTITYVAGDYISGISRVSEVVEYGGNGQGCAATVNSSSAQYTYSFGGWYDGDVRVGTGATFIPRNVTSDVTYVAKGERVVNTYVVDAVANPSNRGSVIDSTGGVAVPYGTACRVECVLNNSNDVFGGWYNGDTKVSSDRVYEFTMVGDVHLEARILYLDVASDVVSIGGSGGSQTFTIQTNTQWTITSE